MITIIPYFLIIGIFVVLGVLDQRKTKRWEKRFEVQQRLIRAYREALRQTTLRPIAIQEMEGEGVSVNIPKELAHKYYELDAAASKALNIGSHE